jgi:hypothetical protein
VVLKPRKDGAGPRDFCPNAFCPTPVDHDSRLCTYGTYIKTIEQIEKAFLYSIR